MKKKNPNRTLNMTNTDIIKSVGERGDFERKGMLFLFHILQPTHYSGCTKASNCNCKRCN